MKLFAFVLAAACLIAGSATRAEQVSIKGSNTFGEKLAPRLIEAFQKTHPDWAVEMDIKNSGYGILSLIDGACDLAASSRAINEDEARLLRSRRIRLNTHAIGYYGIAVIVNRKNSKRNLADHEVRDIFSGAITNWAAVRGPDAPIAVHISTPEAGTYLGFQELALDRLPYRADAVPHDSYAEIAKAVSEDPNAVGYVAMSMLDAAPVRAVTINGVAATPIAVADNLYPYARLLRFFTNKENESSATMEFIRYVRSTEGQNVLEESGFVRRFQRRLSFGMETP